MDLLMINDFTTKKMVNGYIYTMENDGGKIDVYSYCLDPGMVISIMNMEAPSFTNRERIGDMNCIGINITIYGRAVYKVGNRFYSKPVGTVSVGRPNKDEYSIYSPLDRCKNIVLGLDCSSFILYGQDAYIS